VSGETLMRWCDTCNREKPVRGGRWVGKAAQYGGLFCCFECDKNPENATAPRLAPSNGRTTLTLRRPT
jgi:hypothetical protein